jgi:hypothetical protein
VDHDLATLSQCMVGFVAYDALRMLTRDRPLVADGVVAQYPDRFRHVPRVDRQRWAAAAG